MHAPYRDDPDSRGPPKAQPPRLHIRERRPMPNRGTLSYSIHSSEGRPDSGRRMVRGGVTAPAGISAPATDLARALATTV